MRPFRPILLAAGVALTGIAGTADAGWRSVLYLQETMVCEEETVIPYNPILICRPVHIYININEHVNPEDPEPV